MTKADTYRILFVNPPLEHVVKMEMSEDVIEEMGHYPPLGLLYLATYLKERSAFPVEVKVVDSVPEKKSHADIRQVIKEWEPDMCCVTTFTPSIVDALMVCRSVKETNPDIKTVLGGHHVDSYPAESLSADEVDFIIKGEGEESLNALVSALKYGKGLKDIPGLGYKENGKTIVDERYPFIKDLDSVPLPDRGLVNNGLYTCSLGTEAVVATVMTSRGCPYGCTFCYCPTKNYRMRSIPSIIAELKEIKKMGITEIFFFDDLFNVSAARVADLSRVMIDEKLGLKWSFRGRVNHVTPEMLKLSKKAGCQRIHYGIETASDDRLKRINKKTTVAMIKQAVLHTRKAGITAVGSFMIGLPGETREEIADTFRFMRELGLDYAQISVLMPYPNTELYRTGLESGVIKKDYWKEFAMDPVGGYSRFEAQVWTEILSQAELFGLVNVGYKEFYLRPAYIMKSLFRTRSAKELFNKIHGGMTVVKEVLKNAARKK